MANVNVRGLSDATKEALRVRAAQAGLTLEAFARKTLQKASLEPIDQPEALTTLIAKYFGKNHGVELALPERSSSRESVDFS